jgi:hypothetical protein
VALHVTKERTLYLYFGVRSRVGCQNRKQIGDQFGLEMCPVRAQLVLIASRNRFRSTTIVTPSGLETRYLCHMALPTEIFLQILRNLPQSDIRGLRVANRRFHTLASPLAFRTLEVTDSPHSVEGLSHLLRSEHIAKHIEEVDYKGKKSPENLRGARTCVCHPLRLVVSQIRHSA